jgi:uncharacterized delta-60 repeat protein
MNNPNTKNYVARLLCGGLGLVILTFACTSRAAAKGGDLDPAFTLSPLVRGTIYSITVQSDGKVLVGGSFGINDGAARNGIARLNADGSLDASFQDGMDGIGAGGHYVNSIVVQTNGRVLIGGYFAGVNGVDRRGIARLNADGSLDNGFENAMAGAIYTYCPPFPQSCYSYLGQVNSVAVQSDGKVFVGGYFNRFNNAVHHSIARLNADGSLDSSFQDLWLGDDSSPPTILSVAPQADGKVIIGGSFGIARLNVNGRADTNFVPTANSSVWSIALQTNGQMLIGGYFNSVNGTNRNRIARLNANGSVDTTFQSGLSGSDDYVFSIALQTNAKVLIGGRFASVNGWSRANLARLNVDGSLDTSFQNGLAGADSDVQSVALQSDGKALIGGSFLNVNGASSPYLARLYGIAPLLLGGGRTVSNKFEFNLTGEPDTVAIVEASTNLLNWVSVKTNILTGESIPFTDSAWTNFSRRFYRARAL